MTKRVASVTLEQEVVIRAFIDGARRTNLTIPKTAYLGLLESLGYKIVAPGIRINRATPVRIRYGDNASTQFVDEYHTDWEELQNEGAIALEDPTNTGASEPTEGN